MIRLGLGRHTSGTASRSAVLSGEWLLLTSLFLLGVLTRLPFASQILYHWDSVNFAFALDRFDVALDQPQVPGYILYVALGQIVNALFHDPQTTLVSISLVSSGLAVLTLYLLGRDLFSRETGLIAALFLAASPLFWFYGEIALPHSLDTFAVVGVAWLLYRARHGDGRFAVPAAIALAIAGGLRPQTQVFLMPLALWAGWRLGWRRIAAAMAAMVVVDVLWFVPLMASVGGVSRYLEIFGAFSRFYNETTTVFTGGLTGLTRNLTKLGMYTLYGWGAAVVPAVVYGLVRLPTALKLLRSNRAWFLLLWIVPSAAYYTLIHMGQQGLVFVYLPALLLISAESLRRLTAKRQTLRRISIAGLTALGAIIFLASPTYPLGGDRFKLLTWDTLRAQDHLYQERVATVRRDFPTDRSIVISSQWRHAEYYLAGYPLIRFDVVPKWEVGEGQARSSRPGVEVLFPSDLLGHASVPGEVAYLIVFDDELLPFLDSPQAARQHAAAGDYPLTYLELRPGESITIDADSFGVLTQAGHSSAQSIP